MFELNETQRLVEAAVRTWCTDHLAPAVPALEADASDPQVLLAAGLRHPMCKGVLALTGDAPLAQGTEAGAGCGMQASQKVQGERGIEGLWHARANSFSAF